MKALKDHERGVLASRMSAASVARLLERTTLQWHPAFQARRREK